MESGSCAHGSLADDVLVLGKSKGLNDFSLDSFLVAVAWSSCKAYAELLVDKSCKSSRSFEGSPVGLVDEDQRIFLGLEGIPNIVLDLVLALSQPPKILKVSFISFHEMLVVVDHVNLLKHTSLKAKKASEGHDP